MESEASKSALVPFPSGALSLPEPRLCYGVTIGSMSEVLYDTVVQATKDTGIRPLTRSVCRNLITGLVIFVAKTPIELCRVNLCLPFGKLNWEWTLTRCLPSDNQRMEGLKQLAARLGTEPVSSSAGRVAKFWVANLYMATGNVSWNDLPLELDIGYDKFVMSTNDGWRWVKPCLPFFDKHCISCGVTPKKFPGADSQKPSSLKGQPQGVSLSSGPVTTVKEQDSQMEVSCEQIPASASSIPKLRLSRTTSGRKEGIKVGNESWTSHIVSQELSHRRKRGSKRRSGDIREFQDFSVEAIKGMPGGAESWEMSSVDNCRPFKKRMYIRNQWK